MRHACVLFLAVLAAPGLAGALENRAARVSAASAEAVHDWTLRVDRLVASGELQVRQVREDTMIAGRQHERLAQVYKGVPVFGGELARQTDGTSTLTVFGTLYEGLDLEVAPRLRAADAERVVAALGGRPFGSRAGPELMVLPLEDGGYRLVYRVRALLDQDRYDIRQYFVDAATGAVVHEYSDLQTQAVGSATGVLNDRKKISVRQSGSTYQALDGLRPPVISTYDYRGNLLHFLTVPDFFDADLAVDADNNWTDGANVDAQVYAGYTYDYYFKRHGRRGLDNANIPIRSITHTVRREDVFLPLNSRFPDLYINASYQGDGIMLYGEGLNFPFQGQSFNYFSGALDIVAHELTHGVTDYSSRLVYQGESGALNEAFSDIMAAGVEFYFQPAGSGSLQADYLVGEDVITPGGIRSMQNPLVFGDPDHYSIRFTGNEDNGGVHINSGIINNAFYLAVEGGTHRLSRVVVQGVGGANREQVERSFYRGFTSFLTSSANFSQARVATIQAARELYGAGSPAERALTQAWTAVGVQ